MATPARRTDNESSFEEIFEKLADGARLSSSEIASLSSAAPEEQAVFGERWPDLTAEARASLLGRMLELAEDDATLDFSPLYRVMLGDAEPAIRSGALRGLWENEDPTLVRKLISLLQADPDATVRAAAAEALGKFAMLAEHGKLRPETADLLAGTLLVVFKDDLEETDVRRRALEAAAYLSRHDVREAITGAYDSDDPALRSSALFAAGRNLDPSWLETLIDETTSELPEIRYEAAVACGEYEDERAVPCLVRLTEDDDAEVRLAAVTALGKVGGRRARSRLEELTRSPEEATREMAAQALEDMAEQSRMLSGEIEPLDLSGAEFEDEDEDEDGTTYAG